MEMRKTQGFFNWVLIVSETSHIFCCVLPSIFSIISVMIGMGLVGAMPIWMENVHEAMHVWEIPLMVMSGVVVLIGWGLYRLSTRMDCHETGCTHGPCEPKKKNTAVILKIATFLFVVNVMIYVVFHRGADAFGYHDAGTGAVHAAHDDHHH
jgi:hypothetical protein